MVFSLKFLRNVYMADTSMETCAETYYKSTFSHYFKILLSQKKELQEEGVCCFAKCV